MAGKSPKARAKGAASNAKKKRGQGARKKCVNCKKRKTCKDLYEKHAKQMENTKDTLTPAQKADVAKFKQHYEANKGRYESIGKEAGVPGPLVAALHWREKTGGPFDVYLHNGQKLGQPTTMVPRGVNFGKGEFDKAAVAGLNQQKRCKEALGMDENTTDKAKMAAFAESWNGQGYDMRNTSSPYVYSGTDQYSAGKFLETPGHKSWYSPTTVDAQTGVIPLVNSVSP